MSYADIPWDLLIPPPTEINNDHIDYTVFGTVIALGIVTSLVVFTRLVCRYGSGRLGNDDYAITFAVFLYIGWTAMAGYIILHSGIDKPIGEITYGEFIIFYKGVYVCLWMYPIMSASIRVSVLLFYRSIFADVSRVYAALLWTLVGLQFAYVVTFEIMPGFLCHPLVDGWEPIKRMTSCSDLYVDLSLALYSTSLAFDIILLVFPIYATACLKLSLRKRIGVVVIFALGASASVVAAYKLARFEIAVNDWAPPTPDWFNYQAAMYIPPQFNQYGRLFWIPTQVEPSVALIGTSLPALLKAYSSPPKKFQKLYTLLSSGRTTTTRRTTSSSRTTRAGEDTVNPPSPPLPSGYTFITEKNVDSD